MSCFNFLFNQTNKQKKTNVDVFFFFPFFVCRTNDSQFTLKISICSTQILKKSAIQRSKTQYGIREYGPLYLRITYLSTPHEIINTNSFFAVSKTLPGSAKTQSPGKNLFWKSFFEFFFDRLFSKKDIFHK